MQTMYIMPYRVGMHTDALSSNAGRMHTDALMSQHGLTHNAGPPLSHINGMNSLLRLFGVACGSTDKGSSCIYEKHTYTQHKHKHKHTQPLHVMHGGDTVDTQWCSNSHNRSSRERAPNKHCSCKYMLLILPYTSQSVLLLTPRRRGVSAYVINAD